MSEGVSECINKKTLLIGQELMIFLHFDNQIAVILSCIN